MQASPARALLLSMLDAAIGAASPALCVPAHLPPPPTGRTLVVGAGKAAAAMAAAVEAHWPADKPLEGLVVTRYGHALPCMRIEVVEAAHPVPDAAGQAAAQRILTMVQGLTEDDLILCLISGGGSALLTAPAPGITLDDKRAINQALLRSGASIGEMNAVRKHLSAIKGGRLAAAAAPTPMLTLMISDVPGDDPSVIASGPTVGDPTTRDQAIDILARYGIGVPPAVARHLADPASESPKPGAASLAHVRNHVIATPRASLEAAAAVARAAGYAPLILGDDIEGEAREVAADHAALARACLASGEPARPPCVLLSGGETTVTVRGRGRGGRNAEFLLALAVALDGHPGISALAADTDGIDGTEDNAGAVITPDTLARAAAAGIDPRAMLAQNNAYEAFAALTDLVVTGPTLTNVNDFRAVLIEGAQA
jgi:hydroxypyruvate reductase